jgi:hypothetical protein
MSEERKYKTKKGFGGIEVWDGIPDNVEFIDPESPDWQDYSSEMFIGALKVLNQVYEGRTAFYSAYSEEYDKYYNEFKSLITKDAKSVWSGGWLVGFNEFDKSVFDKKKSEE